MESKYLKDHLNEPTTTKWVKEIDSLGYYEGEVWVTIITVNEFTGDTEKELIIFDAMDILKSGFTNKKELKSCVRKKLAKL